MIGNQYFKQAELLAQLLPFLNTESDFAMQSLKT